MAFRLVGFGLWLATLLLYRRFIATLMSPAASLVAALGVASLALWGTPLMWVSGSQDLWVATKAKN